MLIVYLEDHMGQNINREKMKDTKSTETSISQIAYLLQRAIPPRESYNIGVLLISIYFILEFGSIQMLFPVINQLHLPFMTTLIALFTACYAIATGLVQWQFGLTRSFTVLCIFVILYCLLSTRIAEIRIELVKSFLGFLAYYILATSFIKKEAQYLFIIDVWLGSIMFSSLHGIMQGGKIWGSMWLKDENTISLLAAMAFPFACMLFKLSRSKLRRLFYLLCIVMYICLNIVAHSRGGTLSLGIGIFFIWMLGKHRIRNIIILLIFLIIGVGSLPNYFIDDMKTLEQGTSEGTAADRVYLWGFCLDMFYDNPFIGVGPSNYMYYFSSYEKGRRYPLGSRRPPHSTPLQWLAEMGFIGSFILLTMLWFMYTNWRYTMKLHGRRPERPPDSDSYFFSSMSNSVCIATVVFWFGSIFLSLMPYPFFWCLPYFSETLHEIASTPHS